MKENKYQHSPFMTVAIIVMFFGCTSLVYTNWGTETIRSAVAILMMFWAAAVGYMIREGVQS